MDRFITEKETLELLLNAYVEMVRMKSTEPGEKSHMLAHHTEFIKRRIAKILNNLEKRD